MPKFHHMSLSVGLAVLVAFAASIAAWFTHVVVCIQALSGASALVAVIMLGLGVFVPPIGAIHGFMIWFGAGIF